MMRIHLCYYFVQVLREIDPSDRLLESVTDPVRAYLRGRNDTVRCIITRYATRVVCCIYPQSHSSYTGCCCCCCCCIVLRTKNQVATCTKSFVDKTHDR